MRRAALWILATAGGLTALVLVAVAIAVATVDPKTLIGPVQARVKATTGRDLVFGGPIDLKLSLEPKLVASEVTLSNAPWGRAPHLAQAKRVEVQVALLPLLQKRFEVVEVALIGPTIALETDAQGRTNWDSGAPSAAQASATTPTPPPTSAAAVVAVGNIVIRDGALTYRDGATGKTTGATIERLAIRSRSSDAPIDAEFKGRIDDIYVAVTGNLGPIDALRERRWPYPVAIKGDIGGKPANVSTKVAIQSETTTLDALDLAWGTLTLKGEVRIVRANARTRYEFALSSPALSLQDAAVAGVAAAGVKPPGKGAPASRYVIPDTALPLETLQAVDLDGTLAIDDLVLDPRNRLRAVTLKVTNTRGRLDVPTFRASGYGGTLAGRVSIDAAGANAPIVQLRIDGRDLDLDALLKAIGESRQVRGGKTAVTLDIAARGNSLHAWAASANGQVLVTTGPATLVNTRIDFDDVLDKLSGAVNPYRQRDPSTELVCAVIRLPLTDGIARVDRSIAMETNKIAVSASGTLDFREEKLDFTLRPRVREGIPLDLPSFAELVHITGPFAHPAVKLDAVRSAATVAKIGAAISTGGLSVLGTSLIAKTAEEGNECEVAMARKAPAATRPARTGGEPVSPQTIGSEVGKALGRLLGK